MFDPTDSAGEYTAMIHVSLLKAFDRHNDILFIDACVYEEFECKEYGNYASVALKRWDIKQETNQNLDDISSLQVN